MNHNYASYNYKLIFLIHNSFSFLLEGLKFQDSHFFCNTRFFIITNSTAVYLDFFALSRGVHATQISTWLFRACLTSENISCCSTKWTRRSSSRRRCERLSSSVESDSKSRACGASCRERQGGTGLREKPKSGDSVLNHEGHRSHIQHFYGGGRRWQSK